jgi:hypothetical protein
LFDLAQTLRKIDRQSNTKVFGFDHRDNAKIWKVNVANLNLAAIRKFNTSPPPLLRISSDRRLTVRDRFPSPFDGAALMTIDPTLARSFAATVDWLYAGLIRTAYSNSAHDAELANNQGLGGKLLYAGELDGAGSPLVVAANIAGAATLAASTDKAAQRQAIHDGVIDFLVTTLDEALRILKNEVRKHATVAVCVTQPPEDVERTMLELGVLPDVLPPGVLDAPRFQAFLDQGAQQINPLSANSSHTVLTWSVTAAPAICLPKLDAIARNCLRPEEWSAHRWLRLSPRYLGRLAQGIHLLRCESVDAYEFVHQVQDQVAQGEIEVPVDIHLSSGGHSELRQFSPYRAGTADAGFSSAGRRRPRSGSRVR